MMKVTHVYKDVYPPVTGGIEKHIDALRTGMPETESSVVVCRGGRGTEVLSTSRGHEVRVGELGRFLSTPFAPTFPYWLRRSDADLFHVHMPNPLGELSAVLALGRRPYVVSYHADIVRQAWLLPIYQPIIDACLRRARRVIVGSEALRSRSPLLAKHRERVDLVPYAVDTERLDPARVSPEAIRAVRERYGTPLVLALGRLVYYKGFDNLLAAAGLIDASVVVVGGGPLHATLRELADGQLRAHLTGEIAEEDLPAMLGAADCFVLPSVNRAESFGIATLEAQAMGIPAIVSDVGTGTVEAIEPGRTGLVVPPGDTAALAEAIRSLLEDPERRKAMGAAARERVVARHSLAAEAKAMQRVYETALSSVGSTA